MKKHLLLFGVLSFMPLIAQSDVSLDINMPGINLHLGDQDKRGYYWDGYDWQSPQWWKEHRGAHIGERNERGYYWDGGRWQKSQIQQGRNPFSEQNRGKQDHGNGMNNNPQPQRGEGAKKHSDNNNKGGNGQNQRAISNNAGPGTQQVYPQQDNHGHR
ncbi:hypothetical protein B7R74_04095 [Yersinia pseudotuberculosis]|uniref:Protein of uncharacterized function (DUF2502) n=1 Tax=Yersinia pseudotuberculosis TaxID=633 RepID=A0A0T9JF28_YERPU|nr:DUF2502 domain-containing protein [Yersinia pseudotuberculosis]PSH23206.1 hypothetical protein B7R74_04095 [Yersinia pseudotuberculosis]CNC48178.1 Protein of uncharacterised function (DUF2502) [Yersinia pseudotuberculosis]SUP83437.1 Protein of uncharacterised function (DUF2502) [Yersinia pseudotuberculosis]